jgi:hypothetical protein
MTHTNARDERERGSVLWPVLRYCAGSESTSMKKQVIETVIETVIAELQ